MRSAVGTQIDVLVSREERDRPSGQGRHSACRRQQRPRQGWVRFDEFAPAVSGSVVAPIRERHVEVGQDAVAAHRREAAAAGRRLQRKLHGVRAGLECHLIAVGRHALRVVLDDRRAEGAAAARRLEASLDVTEHEGALESGPDDPGQVVRRMARDADQAPSEGAKPACHRAERSPALSGVSSAGRADARVTL